MTEPKIITREEMMKSKGIGASDKTEPMEHNRMEIVRTPKHLEAPLRGFPMLVVVPDSLSVEIHKLLDAAFVKTPEVEKDRDILYHQLVSWFNDHGQLPEFSLLKKPIECSVCRRCFTKEEYREHRDAHPCE